MFTGNMEKVLLNSDLLGESLSYLTVREIGATASTNRLFADFTQSAVTKTTRDGASITYCTKSKSAHIVYQDDVSKISSKIFDKITVEVLDEASGCLLYSGHGVPEVNYAVLSQFDHGYDKADVYCRQMEYSTLFTCGFISLITADNYRWRFRVNIEYRGREYNILDVVCSSYVDFHFIDDGHEELDFDIEDTFMCDGFCISLSPSVQMKLLPNQESVPEKEKLWYFTSSLIEVRVDAEDYRPNVEESLASWCIDRMPITVTYSAGT
jgi:hypothetical protein